MKAIHRGKQRLKALETGVCIIKENTLLSLVITKAYNLGKVLKEMVEY